ncbi:hypothetical protein ACSXBP_11340 [Clostridium perfringens]|uniref:hypothetical protein n=1 Tax=Clostridium perfringens TaxID=1502 RepID=UPI001897637E|nr:hypothetical protein [Clostridium perfringens]HAT4093254.1 hypothetical protein [Clostridium perfringens]
MKKYIACNDELIVIDNFDKILFLYNNENSYIFIEGVKIGFDERTFTLSTINLNKYIDNLDDFNIKNITKKLIFKFFKFLNEENNVFNIGENIESVICEEKNQIDTAAVYI